MFDILEKLEAMVQAKIEKVAIEWFYIGFDCKYLNIKILVIWMSNSSDTDNLHECIVHRELKELIKLYGVYWDES